MIIMWMHTFKYYRSSVRKKFWFSSKLINFPKTLIYTCPMWSECTLNKKINAFISLKKIV